jgi:hypothetical protein
LSIAVQLGQLQLGLQLDHGGILAIDLGFKSQSRLGLDRLIDTYGCFGGR